MFKNCTVIVFVFVLALSACGGSGSDSSDITPTVPTTPTTPTNSSPTGNITIAGTLIVNSVLTASNNIADSNGLGTLVYQWRRTANSTTIDIAEANAATYTIVDTDVDNTLSLVISYTDGDNFSERVTSTETAVVSSTITPSNKPNILLIISDDQGLDASAQYSYSNDIPATPTLNELAEEGITFDNAWATPACTTTRATIITGEHGVNSGVDYVPAILDSSTDTLQRHLKAMPAGADYQTAVIGKWHLAGGNPDLSHPTDSGVDYYAGSIGAAVEDYYQWTLTDNGVQTTSTEYHTTKITDLAIDWLAEQNLQNSPWFLWLAYAAPHSPFHLPPADLHTRTELSGTTADINSNKRDYYLAAIEAMDSEIGRLIDSLPDDVRDNTLIIFVGDNGTPNGVLDTQVYQSQHGKGTLYEGGVRVPLVVSGVGVTRRNVRESALVNTTDFYSTILNVVDSSTTQIYDSYSFKKLLTQANSELRQYNYSEFSSADVTGWALRTAENKLIELDDGSQMLFKVDEDLSESDDLLIDGDFNTATLVEELSAQANIIRGTSNNSAIDITNIIMTNQSGSCADYVENYQSSVLDINNSTLFIGSLAITISNGKCIFQTNNIPNHDFHDGAQTFPNDVSEQDNRFEITTTPTMAANVTNITLQVDNAILLNGVKVDLLAAACFGVGDGKVGCNDINQPWRYDPMFANNGFRVDSHNAHTQPDGSYHYHGTPNALYTNESGTPNIASPVVGFAADGYPIFGPHIDDNGAIRKALSSYQLISGSRPSSNDNPGGTYDGTYRDDYEYIAGSGDLDECNGMIRNGVYGYYISEGFPYILTCFKGTPDSSFIK